MLITKKELVWNYAATFLKIASSILLLPLILKMMPSEKIGIYTIFMTITAFVGLLDFGFGPSFTRNITYIFSGVKSLLKTGIEIESKDLNIDLGLLKGIIHAMRWFYLSVTIILFILLSTLGTYYMLVLIKSYNGDYNEIYFSWGILILVNSYNLYTLYYESLLQGKGLIKKSKQIVVIGQLFYLLVASVLILNGNDLLAIVTSQALSVLIIRWISHRVFFTPELKQKLEGANARSRNEILQAIFPNALKIGLTTLGGFLVQKTAIIVGSLYLSLNDIASYGISMQVIAIISSLSGIYIYTYYPKISQLRVKNNIIEIKSIYLKGQIYMILTYVITVVLVLLLGEWGMNIIRSKTSLMNNLLILVASVISLLETNHSIAGSILLTKNEVPFFKSALLSGISTVILLIIFFKTYNWGVWIMVMAPGLVQLAYQNWKWPSLVWSELKISRKDISISILNTIM